MENEVILTTPIQAHGEEVSKLTFRKPTVKDLNKLGQPFTMLIAGESQEIKTNTAAVSNYIVALANIPMSSVLQLELEDWQNCWTMILSFFGASRSESS